MLSRPIPDINDQGAPSKGRESMPPISRQSEKRRVIMDQAPIGEPIRPRDLALLLLASGDLRPRQRARDQQADRTGMEIKRRILEEIAALDPEPEELEAVLVRMIDDFGPPTGPTRAVASI